MNENFSYDFPELNDLPVLDEDHSTEENINYETSNLDKIYEYLNEDMQEQDILIQKLEEFEQKLDTFLKNQK